MKQYPDYLVHYNKNHSKVNGQFVSGDGDGDGVANDHANQKKQLTPEEKKKRAKRNAWIAVGAGTAATLALGTAMVLDYRNEKIRSQTRAKEAQEVIDRFRASKAKFVGGDW